jgi:hypothetical protein
VGWHPNLYHQGGKQRQTSNEQNGPMNAKIIGSDARKEGGKGVAKVPPPPENAYTFGPLLSRGVRCQGG